jgi:hypothetical protein
MQIPLRAHGLYDRGGALCGLLFPGYVTDEAPAGAEQKQSGRQQEQGCCRQTILLIGHGFPPRAVAGSLTKSNQGKFGSILTKIKGFGGRLVSGGKRGPSGLRRCGDRRHRMTGNIGPSSALADLLEIDSAESTDWDARALADWPNIAPGNPAMDSPAFATAADFDHAS